MKRKFFKRLLWLFFILLLLMNMMAYFHAYKFTHFAPAGETKTSSAGKMSFGQKLDAAFFGVTLPRPQNNALPALPYETVKIKSDKQLEAWFIPAKDAKGTVALFHGYGGEKSSMLDKAAIFHQLGYNTFLLDFRGCGGSEGNETTIGFKEAEEVKASVDHLVKRGESNIILFGTSLGAAAVMKALNDHSLPVQSIIIECPFGTMLQAVKNRFEAVGVPSFPMAYLLLFWGGVQNGFNGFAHRPEEYAKNIKCPTLLFYGEKDIKVKAAETESIYTNLGGAKKLVRFPLAAHENYLRKYRTEWTSEVTAFLAGN